MTLYDTADHRISGVSQQQGSAQRLTFSSQHGDIDLERLQVVDSGGAFEQRTVHHEVVREPLASRPTTADVAPAATGVDPFVALEKLADLHARGILDADEFAAKKRELLKRI